jgi:predicted metalloprotease with PDZ domain
VALQPLRRASHEAWVKHYVRDENSLNAGTDYYGHGALVAWFLDLTLRGRDPDGDGLDEVLRLLWRRHAGTCEGYTEADVEAAVAEVAGDDLGALFDRYVGGTALPPVEEAVSAVGLRFVPSDGPTPPDLGVQLEESDTGVRLGAVLRGRPAWQAGLSGGDEVVAVDGTSVRRGDLAWLLRACDPGDEVAVTVRRGPRVLTRTVTLGAPRPQVRLVRDEDATDAQRDAFRRWTSRSHSEAPAAS